MINNFLNKDFNELKRKLMSLDSDEGVKIQSKNAQFKVFVNKRASGSYVVEILNKTSSSAEGRKDDIKFFESVDQLIEYINDIIGKAYSVIEY